MIADLIYDIGMNNGDDTAYYLFKGYRVVAVEADPTLIEKARERFADDIRRGQLELLNVAIGPREETASFWTQIMGEHADFIAHLLDPAERDLIMKAMQTGDAFHKMHDNLPATKDPVETVVDDIIDFKVAAEKGITTGRIKSIIHPSLADHVRREALKAADDLKRAA